MRDALRRALGGDPGTGHVDDGALAAYLDGSLSPADRNAVEEHAGRCERCSEELAVAARVEIEAAALERVERAPARAGSRRSAGGAAPPARTWLRIAAGLALLIGAGLFGREVGRLAAGRLEPALLSRLEDWSERSASLGGLDLKVAGGPGVELGNLRLAEDPAFGEGDFFSVGRVSLQVRPAALLSGRLAGSIDLERPVLRLVRNRLGQWNVETVGGKDAGTRSTTRAVREEIDRALAEAARGEPPRGVTEDPRVEIASATVRDGVLEIADLGRSAGALRVDDLSLSYQGVPGGRATLAMNGRVGSGEDRIALRGEIGPFEGDVVPVYRFREVDVDGVPVSEIPGAPLSVAGDLTFDGSLESAGRSLDEIVAAARGRGKLALCCGAFRGRNVVRELVAELASLPGADEALAAARGTAALSAVLDAPDTAYDRLDGSADLEPGTLHVEGLAVEAPLFRASADASIGLEGHLAAEGTIRLAPELGNVLLAAAPMLAPLVRADGSFHVPFEASGTWPDLHVRVDGEEIAAAVQRAAPFDLLAFLRPLPSRRGRIG